MNEKLSGRERALLDLARRETDPTQWHRFQPITRGPVVAWVGIACLGAVVPFFVAATLIRRALGGRA